MRFVSFTSFFPQEKNKEILSRSLVEMQKEVRWDQLSFLGGEGWSQDNKPTLERRLIS